MRGSSYRRTLRHTTHHQDLPERVTIVRQRHPFEGKSLAVLQATHRHGRLYFLLILPDGSKSLIPAAGPALRPCSLLVASLQNRSPRLAPWKTCFTHAPS